MWREAAVVVEKLIDLNPKSGKWERRPSEVLAWCATGPLRFLVFLVVLGPVVVVVQVLGESRQLFVEGGGQSETVVRSDRLLGPGVVCTGCVWGRQKVVSIVCVSRTGSFIIITYHYQRTSDNRLNHSKVEPK